MNWFNVNKSAVWAEKKNLRQGKNYKWECALISGIRNHIKSVSMIAPAIITQQI